MLSFVRKYPIHLTVIALCAYPMIKVQTGAYDESLGIVPKNAAGVKKEAGKGGESGSK